MLNTKTRLKDEKIVFFLGYYIGPQGGLCKDIKHKVNDKEECKVALTILGYQEQFLEDFWTDYAPDVPSGCSIKIINQQIFPHLINSSDLGRGNNAFTPICKGPEDTGDF